MLDALSDCRRGRRAASDVATRPRRWPRPGSLSGGHAPGRRRGLRAGARRAPHGKRSRVTPHRVVAAAADADRLPSAHAARRPHGGRRRAPGHPARGGVPFHAPMEDGSLSGETVRHVRRDRVVSANPSPTCQRTRITPRCAWVVAISWRRTVGGRCWADGYGMRRPARPRLDGVARRRIQLAHGARRAASGHDGALQLPSLSSGCWAFIGRVRARLPHGAKHIRDVVAALLWLVERAGFVPDGGRMRILCGGVHVPRGGPVSHGDMPIGALWHSPCAERSRRPK